jgi:3-isopropylmalate/(R)-2-methylmalate dehydratase small subunit
MKVQGKAWKVGDNVDTDLIIPARFLNISDKDEMGRNCFADLRPGFVGEVKPGDILVAGSNFGCGSSREHAPWALKRAGIGAVIAKSFARLFYRNAFNIGLPIVESDQAPEQIEEGEKVSLDFSTGEIVNKTSGKRFLAKPVPPFMRAIIEAGGLVEYVKKTQGTDKPGGSTVDPTAGTNV